MTAFAIRGDEIDYELARGSKDVGNGNEHDEAARSRRHAGPRVSSLSEVLANRRILIFAASAVLFQLANAAMWPLVGQRISVDKPQSSSLLMAAGIIVAQLVMIPVAALAGRLTEARGRKSIFLIGFISLPIRGVLFTLSDQPSFVISVQILDGVGVGVFGVLSVLVVADLTRGTGHFNFTQGAIAAAGRTNLVHLPISMDTPSIATRLGWRGNRDRMRIEGLVPSMSIRFSLVVYCPRSKALPP